MLLLDFLKGILNRTKPMVDSIVKPEATVRSGELVSERSLMTGIDVSKWQGQIDWAQVKTEVQFAYIKATEGVNFVDSRALTNAIGAQKAGIPFGFYHFATPSKKANGELDARDEARDFAMFLDKHIGDDWSHHVLPPVLDLEKNKANLRESELALWVHEFMDELRKVAGVERAMLYTYVSFIREHFSVIDHGLDKYPLWLAHYTEAEHPSDVVRYGFPEWTVWQYDDEARVTGVNGNVDINRARGDLY